MAFSRVILALAGLLGLALAAAGDSPLAPRAGLLLLRNGHILEGHITQAGDYFIVTLGETGEIRLPRIEVEAQVASLDAAYELKRHGMVGRGAEPNLDLAEWCLQHDLHPQCGEQLAQAVRIDSKNPRIAQLERRLKLATAAPPPAVAKAKPAPTAIDTAQMEKTIRALPPGSLERFSAVVQPLLLNRCGANACHGSNSKGEYRLLRPPTGQAASQRFTQRNLYATLAQLDHSNPDASPLLVEPQRRHGTALTAVFDKQTQRQLAELIWWVKLTVVAPEATVSGATVPATISAAGEPPLSQPAQVAASNAAADSPQGATGDPFDAEIFNRRFDGK
ncbi:MAG: hypothetical protein WD872_07710 [Pirellulaceae bacterium]